MKRPILHLIPNLTGGGMERRMGIITKETSSFFPIHIAYISRGRNQKDIDLGKVRLHKIFSTSNYDLLIILQILILIFRYRPIIIQTWSIQMDIIGGLLSMLFKITHIMMEPISPTESINKTFDLKLKFKELIAFNSIVISNSEGGRDFWKSQKVKKSLLIRNGFNIEQITNVQGRLSSELNSFLKGSEFIIVSSRLSKTSVHKRVDLVLEIFSKLIKVMPNLRLVICGGGELEEKYLSLASRYGVNSKVFFTGFLPREKLWSLFHKASLFISLSRYEGMPNSVVEAAICKTPILLSKIDSHLEIIPEDLAYYINHYDSNYISEIILEILRDNNKYSKKSDLLKEHVSIYSIKEMIKKYCELYKDIYI